MLTKRFIDDGAGNVKALEIVEVEWLPSENGGPPKFVEKPGSEQVRWPFGGGEGCVWLAFAMASAGGGGLALG